MSASHARRTVPVVELRALCPDHPEALYIRREGCPLCAWEREQPRPLVTKAAPVRVPTRHPWKGPR